MNTFNKRWGFTTIANKYFDYNQENDYMKKIQMNSLFKAFSQWLAFNKIANENGYLFSINELKDLIGFPEKPVNIFPLPEQIKLPDMLSVSNDYYSILELCHILGVRVDFYIVHKYKLDEWITYPYISLNKDIKNSYNGLFSVACYKNNYELIVSRTFTTDIGIPICDNNKFILETDFIIRSHKFTIESDNIFNESLKQEQVNKKRKTCIPVISSTDDILEKDIEEFISIRDNLYDKLQDINNKFSKLDAEYTNLEKDITAYVGIDIINVESIDITDMYQCINELSAKNALLNNVLLTKINNIKS